jgi:hypothetical protein
MIVHEYMILDMNMNQKPEVYRYLKPSTALLLRFIDTLKSKSCEGSLSVSKFS